MIKSVQLLILVALFRCVPLAAQVTSAPIPQSKVGAVAVDAGSSTGKIATLERNHAEAQYEKDIAEIKADILEAQTNWFGILTSSIIALFGTLITVVVLILAWRLDKTVTAEIAAAKRDMGAQVEEAGQLLVQAKEKVDVIDRHVKTAEELTRGMPFGEPPRDPQTRNALADLAADAEKKPRSQRSLNDYRALVMDAFIKQNWSKMESRAAAMAYLFEDEADDESMMFALFQKAYALSELSRHEEAIVAYDDIIARYGVEDAPALQEPVAMGLFNKGVNLDMLNRHEDAIAAYDEFVARYGGSDASALQEQVATALFTKGVNLKGLSRHEDAIAAYDDIIARYGGSDAPALQKQVAMALFDKGVNLNALNRHEDAIAAYAEVIARYGRSEAPALQEPVALALFNRGVSLSELSRHEDAIAAYDDVIARYGVSDAPALQERVAMAMVNKGVNLNALNRREDAIAAYDDVIARYGDSDAPALQKQVAMARLNKEGKPDQRSE